MTYADPRKNPNSWLVTIIADLIDQNTENSLKQASAAIFTIVNSLEPGLIDELFHEWIESYVALLEQAENKNSNSLQ